MNLTKYFFDNFDDNEFPYYSKQIKRFGLKTVLDYPCEYIDDEEIIKKWKNLTYPGIFNDNMKIEFILLSFYLLNNGYEIKEHPTLLLKIEPLEYVSDLLFKNATRTKYGTKPNGDIVWADRRAYSDSLSFIKKNDDIPYSTNINDIFKLVSTSNKNFCDMSLDEKLEQIRNVFSYIGKTENGKYIDLDIDTISKGYINKQQLIDYQNELQCFRHGEKDMVEKRNDYTEEQKSFLIDYGLMLINATERFLNNKQ